ncbi:HTH-type transcriptional repressor AseR [compost metagenome]
MSQPSVSQHLRKLKAQGLVKETKRAQWVYYSLNIEEDSFIQPVLNALPDTQTLLSLLNGDYTECACD